MGHMAIFTLFTIKSIGVQLRYDFDYEKRIYISLPFIGLTIVFKKVDEGGWFDFIDGFKD